MFGLMKCNATDSVENLENFRLHYCGTCKSISSLYGQKERLFVNYDIAFLGQIMSSIDNSNFKSKELPESYRSFNCFSTPHSSEVPKVLKYTSTINMFLGELKMDDKIKDEKKLFLFWKFLRRACSKNFNKATKEMQQWGISINELWELIDLQNQREKTNVKFSTLHEAMTYFGETTGLITAKIFTAASVILERPELKEVLYRLGYSFGKLIYLMDASEDYNKDIKEKNFNALASLFKYEKEHDKELINEN